MDIILDTNFIVDCAKYRIDFFSEIDRICLFPYKTIILEKSIEELKKINNKDSKLALQLIKNIPLLKHDGKDVDSIILEIANKDTIVATQDKALKRKLKEKNIPLITIRQKKYLILNRNIY